MHNQVCKAARAFDPANAAAHLSPNEVDNLVATIRPLLHHVDPELMKRELPAYVSSAKDVQCNRDDVSEYSTQVIAFWKSTSASHMPTWRMAARTISPNSASCERVFSLLDAMFGQTQQSSLADRLQVSLMMRYNGRSMECGE